MRNSLLSMVALAAALMLSPVWAFSQNGRRNAPAAAPKPTPHNPDGTVYWGVPGSPKGLWNFQQQFYVDDDPAPGAQRDPVSIAIGRPTVSEVPFQPWARALFDLRQENEFEPYTRCKPPGVFRQVGAAYGTQLIHFPELQQFFIFQTGGTHTYRVIYMDGRDHPADVSPSDMGHSIGWYEGDTLVVDTVGFNENVWIARRDGQPHSEALHAIERFTRTDFNNLLYEVTIDDPLTYTRTWKTAWTMRLAPEAESFESSCQDSNYSGEMMVGTLGKVDRSSPYIP